MLKIDILSILNKDVDGLFHESFKLSGGALLLKKSTVQD